MQQCVAAEFNLFGYAPAVKQKETLKYNLTEPEMQIN
jgi:hypothetical protein